jgi:hypothetical protein
MKIENHKFIRVPVIILIFGIMAVGCIEQSTDRKINGIWVNDKEGNKMKFKNGNYEFSYNNLPMLKGTCTTNNGKIVIQTTHIHGNAFPNGSLHLIWHSINEIEKAFNIMGITDEEIIEILSPIYSTILVSYSVDGKIITITDTEYSPDGVSFAGTYTKKWYMRK